MTTPHPAPDTLEPAGSPAPTRAEFRLTMLDRMVRKSLAMSEAVEEDGTKESAYAFDKNSRAFRLAVTLQAKLEAEPLAWTGRGTAKSKSPGAEPVAEAPDPRAALETGKKARVRELMRDVIDREIADPEENDTLVDALDERLLRDEAYEDIEDQPLRDTLEVLCADLQVRPLWSEWISEAVGWRPKPPFHRPLCSRFRTPSRRPILNDVPDPHTLE